MKKIKSIQITDFRIYEGSQEFSFVNGNDVANLMVIYAPNGFGKTSFFDAVEWCYSGKIRRFESGVIGQQVGRRDFSSGDKILLSNRRSYTATGRTGMVRVQTTDAQLIQRSVTDRKITNLDERHDYRTPSTVDTTFSQEKLNRVVKTNILTQDQIDEFPRHTHPEKRFQQLAQFWPEGSDALSLLAKLESFSRMLTKEEEELSFSIMTTQEKLTLYLDDEQLILPLNAAIQYLIQQSTTGFRMDLLSINITDETYLNMQDEVRTFIEKTNFRISHLTEELSDLRNLELGLPAQNEAVANQHLLEQQLKQFIQLEKRFAERQAMRAVEHRVNTMLTGLVDLQQKVQRLIELHDTVARLQAVVREQERIAADCRREIASRLDDKETYQRSIIQLSSTSASWKTSVDRLTEAISTWEEEETNYRFWNGLLKSREHEMKRIDEQVSVIDQSIENLFRRSNVLQNIIAYHQYQDLPEEDKAGLTLDMQRLDESRKRLDQDNVELKELDEQLKAASGLQETFDRLLAWGEEFVAKTNASHCPLCAAEYQHVTALLQRIELQKSTNNDAEQLREKIMLMTARQKTSTVTFKALESAIDTQISSIILQIMEELALKEEERSLLMVQYRDHEKTKADATAQIQKSAKNYPTNFSGKDFSESYWSVEEKNKWEAERKELRMKIARLDKVIEEKTMLISKKEDGIVPLRTTIEATDVIVAQCRSNTEMNEYASIVKQIGLASLELIEKDNLLLRLEELEKESSLLEQEKMQTDELLQSVQESIQALPVKVTESELAGLIVEARSQLNKTIDQIERYTNSFTRFSSGGSPSYEFFDNIQGERKKELLAVTDEQKLLENLFIELKVIEDNIQKNKLKDSLSAAKERVSVVKLSLTKVNEALQTAKDYISQEINHYFSEDVINQIYSRIEPHPDLHRISIVPKLSDEGAVIDIWAESSLEKLNPSLFLSAGQLNVLSLSIFLAKAFETAADPISTIFMDDPVQNLSDINVLSFIDLIRTMITEYDRQIVISSHDENFYRLLRHKMPSAAFNVKYYELGSFGKPTPVA